MRPSGLVAAAACVPDPAASSASDAFQRQATAPAWSPADAEAGVLGRLLDGRTAAEEDQIGEWDPLSIGLRPVEVC
jgi:uncharacterized protein with LGFP repeats